MGTWVSEPIMPERSSLGPDRRDLVATMKALLWHGASCARATHGRTQTNKTTPMIPISAPAIARLTTSRAPSSLANRRVHLRGPWWREATRGGGHELTNDPIKVKRPADNDRAKQRPNKRAEPSISRLVRDNGSEPSTSYSRN
jgi:hypothetical protein